MDQTAVTAKVLVTPQHPCFGDVTSFTNVVVVGSRVEAIRHKCKEDSKAVNLEPFKPIHWARAVVHCKKCDILYVFEEVEAWMLLIGRDRRLKHGEGT